jgi:hypothetical protein
VLNEIAVLQAFEYFTGIVFNRSHNIAYRRKSPYSLITVLLIMTLINTCGYRGIETSASVMLATSKIARLIVIVSLFFSELSLHKQLRYGVEYIRWQIQYPDHIMCHAVALNLQATPKCAVGQQTTLYVNLR